MTKLLSEAIREVVEEVEKNYNQVESLVLKPQQMRIENEKTKTTHWLYVQTGTNYDTLPTKIENDIQKLKVLETDTRNHRLKVELTFPENEVL